MSKLKIVFLGSKGGSVFARAAKHSFVREMTFAAASDRECKFLSEAESLEVNTVNLLADNGLIFSDLLYERYHKEKNLIFISFYTKLFQGKFLEKFKGRIFNCHPSILPLCKGRNGFEDTISSGCLFMGSTIHIIDEQMDCGINVMQAAIPINSSLSIAENRHKVFLSQYYSILQLLRWAYNNKLCIGSNQNFSITNASYNPSIFSPNLDKDFFEYIGENNELCDSYHF